MYKPLNRALNKHDQNAPESRKKNAPEFLDKQTVHASDDEAKPVKKPLQQHPPLSSSASLSLELARKITGKWESAKEPCKGNDEIVFTKGGQVMYTPRYITGVAVGNYNALYETLDERSIRIVSVRQNAEFRVELTGEDEMIITRTDGNAQPFDMINGRFNRIK